MPASTILVADDDRAIRTVLNQALIRLGHDVRTTGNAATLWRWVADGEGDLVITDVVMPDENGLDLIPRIKKIRPELRVIVMSAQNTLMTAVKAAERGAFEYLPKPFDLKELVNVVERALSAPQPIALNGHAAAEDADEEEQLPLIGRSPAMQEIYRVLARLMGTDLTVMITGESGTGKELVARALHDYGKRRSGPVRRDQHGGDPARADRERAVRPREGRLHRRHDALDRPVRAGRRRHPVPGRDRRHAAGSADPAAARAAGRRVHDGRRPHPDQGGCPDHRRDPPRPAHADPAGAVPRGPVLPPQRGRRSGCRRCASGREDIPALVRHFLTLTSAQGLPTKSIDTQAMERMKRYRWPGNVRELENLVRRLAALYSQEVIGTDMIEAELADFGPGLAPGRGAPDEGLSSAVERHLKDYFAAHKDGIPPPASMTGCCGRSSGR